MPQAQLQPGPRSLDGVRVLLVEDDVDLLELQTTALRQAGARVVAVTNAVTGLDLLERNRFDVIVSDLDLPELDGFTFVRRLRARGGKNARIPALAVTGLAEEEDVAESARAGYDAHVKKPIDPADLALAVSFLVRR